METQSNFTWTSSPFSYQSGSNRSTWSILASQIPFILTALVSLVSLSVALYGQLIQQKVAKKELETEKDKIESEYAVEITKMTLNSLKEKDSQSQEAILAIIQTIEDKNLKTGLSRALGTSDNENISKEAKIIDSINSLQTGTDLTQDYELQVYRDKSSENYFKYLKVNSDLSSSTKLLTKSVGGGLTWDIDVFVCEKKWNGGNLDKTIEEYSKEIAKISDNKQRITKKYPEFIGRVRLRPLPDGVNNRNIKDKINKNVIKPSKNNRISLEIASNLANISKKTT
jgi:hypothetical protein